MAGTGDARIKNDRSKVDNRSASYSNVRDVYNAPVIRQTVVRKEKGVTYGVDKEDVRGLETWSLFLMKHLGEQRTKAAAAVFFLAGGSGFLSAFYTTPAFVASFSTGLMTFSFCMLLLGAAFAAAVQYRYKSRCVKCNTFYAMKEVGNPKAQEVRAKGGVRRTITRTYGCRECGHEIQEKENEFIEDEPQE